MKIKYDNRKFAFFFLVLLFVTACGNDPKPDNVNGQQDVVIDNLQNNDNNTEINDNDIPEDFVPETAAYVYENDTIKQSIDVKYVSPTEMQFTYVSLNKLSGRTSEMEGIATNVNPDGDPEIDEDEEGNTYPAVEYYYEDECVLALRIEKEKKSRMQISSQDCEARESADSPYASAGVMIRQ
ncbi:MAG: hypothetical protein ABIJ16_09655 [Bacteroidota bacterium]